MSDGLLRFVLELSLDFMVVFNFGLSLLLGGNKCNILFVFIHFLADSLVLSSDFGLSFISGLSFNSLLSSLLYRGGDVILIFSCLDVVCTGCVFLDVDVIFSSMVVLLLDNIADVDNNVTSNSGGVEILLQLLDIVVFTSGGSDVGDFMLGGDNVGVSMLGSVGVFCPLFGILLLGSCASGGGDVGDSMLVTVGVSCTNPNPVIVVVLSCLFGGGDVGDSMLGIGCISCPLVKAVLFVPVFLGVGGVGDSMLVCVGVPCSVFRCFLSLHTVQFVSSQFLLVWNVVSLYVL